MAKKSDESIEVIKSDEVEATAANVYVTLPSGYAYKNSATIDLLQGSVSIYAEHTGSKGQLTVRIMETAFFDEAVKTWVLDPGETIGYFSLALPKDSYYLKLQDNLRLASGTGRLGQPMSV